MQKLIALVAVAVVSSCGPLPQEDADMAGGSIFAGRNRRAVLQGQTQARQFIAVATEDEFISALGELPGSDGNCYGKGINVVAPITFRQTVTLSRLHDGLTITSPSLAVISTIEGVDTWLFVGAREVTVRGLFFGSGFRAPTAIKGNSAVNAANFTVRDCIVSDSSAVTTFVNADAAFQVSLQILDNRTTVPASISLLVDSNIDGGVDSALIRGNSGFKGASSVPSLTRGALSKNLRIGQWSVTASTGSGGDSVYSGNVFEGDLLLNNDGNNVISGNAMQGHNINTTGAVGAGGNVIDGNTDVGAITNNAGDVVGDNT